MSYNYSNSNIGRVFSHTLAIILVTFCFMIHKNQEFDFSLSDTFTNEQLFCEAADSLLLAHRFTVQKHEERRESWLRQFYTCFDLLDNIVF